MSIPYAAAEFTKDGAIARHATVDADVTDVLLISHGWNNDIPAAENLFHRVRGRLADLISRDPDPGRRYAMVGLLWPSKQWGSDAADTPGGGLAVGDPADELRAHVEAVIEDPAARDRLAGLSGKLDDTPAARADFVDELRAQLPPAGAVGDDDAMPAALADASAASLLHEIERAGQDLEALLVEQDLTFAGIGGFFSNTYRKMLALVNVVTFYGMKDRAGTVGRTGVAPLLAELHASRPELRLHLAGHSFGARVVSTAAATGAVPIASISLLQGAYSHRGLAEAGDGSPTGAFRRILTDHRLTGPVIVTHTRNDVAVGLAYAVASRLARQLAAGVGGPDDPYGGLGANGAIATREVQPAPARLGDEHERYAFEPGRVYNLRADAFIRNHSDVSNLAVANAILAAMTAGRSAGGAGG